MNTNTTTLVKLPSTYILHDCIRITPAGIYCQETSIHLTISHKSIRLPAHPLDAAALEPFKRNARATLLECEACSEVNGTPLNCSLKFRSPRHRSNHYRLQHPLWWEYHQDLRKWWNAIKRMKKQVVHNRNWRAKKRQQRMEDEDEDCS